VNSYDNLHQSLGSLIRDPKKFYTSIKTSTTRLMWIDDVIDEIGMVRRIQRIQSRAVQALSAEVYGVEPDKREEQYNLATLKPFLETFYMLEVDAERVRSMLKLDLDLRHKEAAIENALSGSEQSTMLFIFTTITVLFVSRLFLTFE
jgi:hypothetical protein